MKRFLMAMLLCMVFMLAVWLMPSMAMAEAGASLTTNGTKTGTELKAAIKSAAGGIYDGQGVVVSFTDTSSVSGMHYDNKGEKARQVYILGDQNSALTYAVIIKNVKFTFDAAVANASGITHAQIYPYLKANVTFENCIFDCVGMEVQAVYSEDITATFKNCTFSKIPNNYGIKHVKCKNLNVENCLFEYCGSGLLISSRKSGEYSANADEVAGTINITGNIFTRVSYTAGDYAEKDRGVFQFEANFNPGDATTISISNNIFTDTEAVMRYLSYKGTFQDILFEGNTFTNENYTLNHSEGITLYRKIKDDKKLYLVKDVNYVVTFDANGHGTALNPQNVGSDGKVTKPTDPTADGYVFGGWYKESECTTAWSFDSDTVTADTTLYAKWSISSAPAPTPSPTPAPEPEPEPVSETKITITISSDDTSGGSASSNLTDTISSMSSRDKAAVTELIVTDNKNLTSLEGVEQLENLESINLNNCTNLESVNLSANTSLTNIAADNCTSLQIIEVKNNEKLETLSVKNAVSLQELDVSGCSSLSSLDCSGGSVEKISLQGCENLKDLSCQNNNLESLDVRGCTNLTSLDCSANNIGDLNVDGCESLESLNCGANSLSSLNVTSCRRLQVLYCYSNNLTELNVQYSERLYILVCDDNSLNTLNVEQNKLLRRLDCQNNAMPALDITSSVFAQLQRLKCYGQSLTGLNVTQSGEIYNFNLRSYMQSGIQSKTFSAASLNADNDDLNNFYSSSSIDNVDETSIKAYDADGNEIEVTGYTSGVISFASKPAKIVYDYDTGYNNTMMDVTISEQTKRNGGSTVETKTSGGGGGGGCDAGFGIFSLLIILAGFFGIKMGTKN